MELAYKPNLKGKTAVVTGGGGVLGADFAKALALCGAKVAILDLNEEAAQKVADEIVANGGTAKGFKCNVLEKENIKECHDKVKSEFGLCDILINGAGGNNPRATSDDEEFNKELFGTEGHKSFFDLEQKGVEFVFNLNFLGTLLPTQEFALDMIDKPGAVIINISSMNAFCPLTKIPAYSGAKAAISNFTQWLAVHFAKTGIRVNAIAPGFFSTAQNAALLWNPDGTPTARTGKIIKATPMGRFGKPEELLGTLMWLVDNESSGFVTGVVIPVDGGFNAYSGV
ncbi:MAG: SDR family oxidoreductase [Treponema sp.]|nr:SDR family oxidoreductase [Treponema sp.]